MRRGIATDETKGTRAFGLALENPCGHLVRRDADAIGGMEGKARGRTEMAGGCTAAEEDRMRRAQRRFLAPMQHFASDVAGLPDATNTLALAARPTTAVRA